MGFHEVQRFSAGLAAWLVVFITALAALVAVLTAPISPWQTFLLIAATSVPILAAYFLFYLETAVTPSELRVRLFPFPARAIALADIVRADSVDYRPLRDFGGWGLRFGMGGTMYNARGAQAVKLELKSGEMLYVGTQRPGDLASSLRPR